MKPIFSILIVAIALTVAGCGAPECDGVDCGHDHGPVHVEHFHPTKGPHQGRLVDLGNSEFHAELVFDEATSVLTVYLLDGNGLDAVGTDAAEARLNVVDGGTARQYVLTASPQLFDTAGEPSCFKSAPGDIDHDLEHVQAQFVVAVRGKQYRGAIGSVHNHGHHHGADDALVWGRPDIQQNGYLISLGHHGAAFYAGKSVEPAVSVMHNGQPISNAQVFNSLWSGDGRRLLADEVSTVYEPPSAEEPAHYAQGELTIPADVDQIVVRFRIVLPGSTTEVSYDLPATVRR